MQTLPDIFNGAMPKPALVTQYNDSLWAMSIQNQVLSAQLRDIQMELAIIILIALVMLFTVFRLGGRK